MQIYDFGNPDASVVLIEPIHVPDGMEQEASLIRELTGTDFRLIAVRVDWFNDLSPWTAPALSGDIPFGNGAGKTLEDMATPSFSRRGIAPRPACTSSMEIFAPR